MTNIEQLYAHIQDLTKQNLDNILVDMITHGTNSNTVGSRIISFTCDSSISIGLIAIMPLDIFRESAFGTINDYLSKVTFNSKSNSGTGILIYTNDGTPIEDGDYALMAGTEDNSAYWNIETINGNTPTTATYSDDMIGSFTCPILTVDANHTEFALVMNGYTTL